MIDIDLIKYDDQFQIGISFNIHDEGYGKHFHLWLDVGYWCVEISIGKMF